MGWDEMGWQYIYERQEETTQFESRMCRRILLTELVVVREICNDDSRDTAMPVKYVKRSGNVYL